MFLQKDQDTEAGKTKGEFYSQSWIPEGGGQKKGQQSRNQEKT